MIKVSLAQVRKMGIFDEIARPETVFHMTDRKNVESILKDGKIKAYDDFMTYFFPSLECVPVYIELTGADHGRKYYDTNGIIRTAPPLNHAETVVLKLTPRGPQKLEWYRERIDETNRTFPSEAAKKIWKYMNEARVCHYGAMPFCDDPEIIELTAIDKLPASESLLDIRRIKRE